MPVYSTISLFITSRHLCWQVQNQRKKKLYDKLEVVMYKVRNFLVLTSIKTKLHKFTNVQAPLNWAVGLKKTSNFSSKHAPRTQNYFFLKNFMCGHKSCRNGLYCMCDAIMKPYTCFSPEAPLLYVVARVELHASEYQGTWPFSVALLIDSVQMAFV